MSLAFVKNALSRLAGGAVNPQFIAQGAASTTALFFGAGTNTYPTTWSAPSKHFIDLRTKCSDETGADSRLMYLRHYLAGAGASGETARIFATVTGAGAVAARGAHISLSFSGSGTCTGEAMAVKGTLHVPDATLGGTVSGVAANLYCDGDSSDVSNGALFRAIVDGDATGVAALDDSAYLIALDGNTIGADNIVQTADATAVTHVIRCKLGGTVLYLMASTTPASN